MNKMLCGFAICILTQACSLPVKDDDSVLLKKLDSINEQVMELKKQMAEKDSINAIQPERAGSIMHAVTQQTKLRVNAQSLPHAIVPVPIKQQPKPIQVKNNNEQTIFYYKGDPKRISVEITPWVNGRRKVKFYDPFGRITYTCDDVRLGYSSVTALKKIYDNGAAEQIEVQENPGAGMYWYDAVITFGINNEPQWKKVHKHPQESLEEYINNTYWWNTETGQWVKQEVVQEQPYTH